jgi:hypothetical protein
MTGFRIRWRLYGYRQVRDVHRTSDGNRSGFVADFEDRLRGPKISRRSQIRQAPIKILALAVCALFTITALIGRSQAQKDHSRVAPVIPKTWYETVLARLEVPLAEAAASPVPVSADYYYHMPVRPLYKSYPVYAPAKSRPVISKASSSSRFLTSRANAKAGP